MMTSGSSVNAFASVFTGAIGEPVPVVSEPTVSETKTVRETGEPKADSATYTAFTSFLSWFRLVDITGDPVPV